MRLLGSLMLLALALAIAEATPQDQKSIEPNFTLKMDYLDKTWNVRLQSIKTSENGTVTFTLEFRKDAANLQEVRKAFGANSEIRFGGATTQLKEPAGILFYAFDIENVVLKKYRIDTREGEITGKMGDAFRIGFNIEKQVLQKIKKLEVRPIEPEVGPVEPKMKDKK